MKRIEFRVSQKFHKTFKVSNNDVLRKGVFFLDGESSILREKIKNGVNKLIITRVMNFYS